MVDTDLLSSFNSLKINNFYKTINSLAKLYSNGLSKKAVLRIHLIFMRIRIWILDLQRKKMDPDPGYFHKNNRIFFYREEFLNQEFFLIVHFFAVFCWYFAPWIRIRGSVYFQKAKILSREEKALKTHFTSTRNYWQ